MSENEREYKSTHRPSPHGRADPPRTVSAVLKQGKVCIYDLTDGHSIAGDRGHGIIYMTWGEFQDMALALRDPEE